MIHKSDLGAGNKAGSQSVSFFINKNQLYGFEKANAVKKLSKWIKAKTFTNILWAALFVFALLVIQGRLAEIEQKAAENYQAQAVTE